MESENLGRWTFWVLHSTGYSVVNQQISVEGHGLSSGTVGASTISSITVPDTKQGISIRYLKQTYNDIDHCLGLQASVF